MIPIDGGGGGAARSALEARLAAARARAEAARRAAAEAARRAAAQAQAALRATMDTVEQSAPRSLYCPAPVAGHPASVSSPTTGYSPADLQHQAGALFALDVAPPFIGPPPSGPAPPDPLEDGVARRLVQVFDEAAAAWARLPPDLQAVTVRPGDGAAAIVEQWVGGGRRGIGPGDPAAYERSVEQNQDGLLELARVLAPPATTPSELFMDGDTTGYVSQLVRPALVALQREHPEATFELLAVESGSLPPRMAGMNGVYDSQLVIQMTDAGGAEHFVLNPYGLFEPPPVNQTMAALEANPPLLDSWYGNVQATLPGHVDQGDARATLDFLTLQRYDHAVIQGILDLPLEGQADFLQAYGAADPSSGERPFGLLNRIDHIGPENVLVSVDATALARGVAPSSLESTVNLAAVDGLNKQRNFVDQNYETLVAPVFAQYATLRGDEPRVLSGTDLVNEIGTAMQIAPNRIPAAEAEIAQLGRGEWELYADEAMEVIAPIADTIRSLGVGASRVSVLPLTFHSPETGIVQLPLFRVEGANGEETFVDNVGRSYRDFEDWRAHNELPPGRVSFPGDPARTQTWGHLATAEAGVALTVTEATHAVVDTPLEVVVRVLDTATLVGGVVVGAALVVGTGGTALPLAAGAIAAWGAARSGGELIDRATHNQTLDLTDPGARAEWLNLGASALGIAALGSGSLARALGASGSRYAAAAAGLARGLNVGAEVADVSTMANLGASLTNPDLSMGGRAAIVAQLAFWGGMTAAAARTAHGSPGGLYSLDATNQSLRDLGMAPSPPPGVGAGEWAVSEILNGPIVIDPSARIEVSGSLGRAYPDVVFLSFSPPDGSRVTVITEAQLMARAGQPDATPVSDFLFDSGLATPRPESAVTGDDALMVSATGLATHEAAGGHLLAQHVGWTDAELAARLAREPRIAAASTFSTEATAAAAVSEALAANHAAIDAWLQGGSVRLVIVHRSDGAVGVSLRRGATTPVAVFGVNVVLVRDAAFPGGYRILTGYPVP